MYQVIENISAYKHVESIQVILTLLIMNYFKQMKTYFAFRIDLIGLLTLSTRVVFKTDLLAMCLINSTLFFRLNLESDSFILYEEINNVSA